MRVCGSSGGYIDGCRKSKHMRLRIEAAGALERRHPDARFVEPVWGVSIWMKQCG
jgi:hypothetical protein